jgi:hypothetical protein
MLKLTTKKPLESAQTQVANDQEVKELEDMLDDLL